jgi:hypothetical protein
VKIGDVIRRKDMPSILYQIVGTAENWNNMWEVKLTSKTYGMKLKSGMIDKNDDRWEVVGEIKSL